MSARKLHSIAEALRQEIVTGVFQPGDRLPTQEELKLRTGVAAATVQRLFNLLSAEGFIVPRGSAGTFVADSPPHLCRYGIVFADYPLGRPPNGTFNSVLAGQCQIMQQRREQDITVYAGLDGHKDVPDYRRAVRELETHRVAGLMVACNPVMLEGTPLLERAGLPRVVVGGRSLHDLPVVTTDPFSWPEKALDYMAARGRQRVAVVAMAIGQELFARFDELMAERGIMTKPHWRLQVHRGLAEGARNPVHLLMEARERPDGLLITDDVFAEHATMGILDAGLSIPDDIDVVSHCNFPVLKRSVLPIKRLGFPVAEVLQKSLEVIDMQRQGIEPPPFTGIQAMFEEELTS